MHKFAEKILEKQLTKIIGDITKRICEENFEAIFKKNQDYCVIKNTTIGSTYEELEEMAVKEVNELLKKEIDEIDFAVWKIKTEIKENPFSECLSMAWHEFIDYIDVRGTIEVFIGEEWSEKQQLLYDCGIVDKEGDYIQVKRD